MLSRIYIAEVPWLNNALHHCPGHGHADALSIELWFRGEPLIIDPGAYQYAAGPWRDYFRGTAAHSTATVDGLDQSVFAGPFRLAEVAHSKLLCCNQDRHRVEIVGEHDGYTRLAQPVLHRRRIQVDHPRRIFIEDAFTGSGRHDLTVRFRLAPGMTAACTAHSASALSPQGTRLRLTVLGDAQGHWAMEQGWASRTWYQKQPSAGLVYHVSAPMPAKITILLEMQ